MEFKPFDKIPRLKRNMTITEKIDGTNALIYIGKDGEFLTGSRSRWITPENDNFDFSKWAYSHKEELMKLGYGFHYGEYWGKGIQRTYGLEERRFSLFNTARWLETPPPSCCSIVPVLYHGEFSTYNIDECLDKLSMLGSAASQGFMKPEGIIIYHNAAGGYFKVTLEKDEEPKGKNNK